MLKYTVNSLIEWKDESESTSIERVLWMDEELVYVIDVNKNSAPYLRSTADIDSALIDGRAVIKEDDAYAVILKEEDIPEKHRKMRDKAWAVINDMVAKEPEIYQSSFRRKAVREASKAYNISELWVF